MGAVFRLELLLSIKLRACIVCNPHSSHCYCFARWLYTHFQSDICDLCDLDQLSDFFVFPKAKHWWKGMQVIIVDLSRISVHINQGRPQRGASAAENREKVLHKSLLAAKSYFAFCFFQEYATTCSNYILIWIWSLKSLKGGNFASVWKYICQVEEGAATKCHKVSNCQVCTDKSVING